MSAVTKQSDSKPTVAGSSSVTVEQAIFTSARTSRLDGYQLVAISPGVTNEDARELAAWGPAHDALIVDDQHESSTNFHPLGPHKFCVARTMLGGAEYSGRRGRRVYTQSLIVKSSDFVRFHNNPFELLIAALAQEEVKPRDNYPDDLLPLRLLPSGIAVDPQLISAHRDDTSVRKLMAWFHEALTQDRLVISGYTDDQEFARFFNLLPVGLRPRFSFSSRLKFSTRRRFRMIGLTGDVEQQRRAVRQDGLPHLNLSAPYDCSEVDRHPWSSLIQVAMRISTVESVAELIARLPLSITEKDLVELGGRLRNQLVRHRPADKPDRPTPPESARAISAAPNSDAAHPAAPEVQEAAQVESGGPDLPNLLAKIDSALEGNIEDLFTLQKEWKSFRSGTEHPEMADMQAACQEHTADRWKQLREQGDNLCCDEAVDILCLIFGIDRLQ